MLQCIKDENNHTELLDMNHVKRKVMGNQIFQLFNCRNLNFHITLCIYGNRNFLSVDSCLLFHLSEGSSCHFLWCISFHHIYANLLYSVRKYSIKITIQRLGKNNLASWAPIVDWSFVSDRCKKGLVFVYSTKTLWILES